MLYGGMKFNIDKKINCIIQSPAIGNVYNVRGGSGARLGYMMIIISIEHDLCTVLTVNKEGSIISGSNYAVHYFEDKCPMAYCAGIEDLAFDIGTI